MKWLYVDGDTTGIIDVLRNVDKLDQVHTFTPMINDTCVLNARTRVTGFRDIMAFA